VAPRVSRPRQLGRDLLVQVGAREPGDIDPIESAKELGIEVTFGQLKGATARISYAKGRARIRVSDEIETEGRRRTSLGHELGHYVLKHVLRNEEEPASWFKASCEHRSRRDERDADVFAVEHLMPEPMVAPYCRLKTVDLHAVRVIERVFRASPVMSAMRLVELSPDACAVAYSERGVVKWIKPSRSFPAIVARGKALARESVAFGFFDRGKLFDLPTRLRAGAWVGASRKSIADLEMIEHAMVIPESGWGGVLSLLWIPDLASLTVAPNFGPAQALVSRKLSKLP
jgi:IrrE N-terminal-like domain